MSKPNGATSIVQSQDRKQGSGKKTPPKMNGGKPSSMQMEILMPKPLKVGLAIVAVLSADLVPHVRPIMEREILDNGDDRVFPLEGGSLLSLHSGNERQLENAQTMKVAYGPVKKGQIHNLEAVGTQNNFDYICGPGLAFVESIIEYSNEKWITAVQKFPGPITSQHAHDLFLLREAVNRAGAGLLLFVDCEEGYEKTGLDRCCDEYFEVAPCEPDPGVMP
jgi:hypothetical protein